MESNKWVKFWLIFLIVYLTFWYLIVCVHETGHLLFGLLLGGQFQSIVLNFPYLFGEPSYVTMEIPGGLASTLFLIGGTLFTIIIGIILTYLPSIYPKVMGWILMIDGIVYPTLTSGSGDFARVDSYFIPIFISLTTAFYILSYINYRKSGQINEKEGEVVIEN